MSKQRGASAGWPWRLLTLSFVVLLTVIAVYAGMKFGFKDIYLQGALADAQEDSKKTFKTVGAEEQTQIFNFYSQLGNIETLLKRQGRGLPYLDMIEKNTLKAITYSNMDIKIDERATTIKMDGKTGSYAAIVQQMELYKKMQNVKDVKLSGARSSVRPGENAIMFSIQITLNR